MLVLLYDIQVVPSWLRVQNHRLSSPVYKEFSAILQSGLALLSFSLLARPYCQYWSVKGESGLSIGVERQVLNKLRSIIFVHDCCVLYHLVLTVYGRLPACVCNFILLCLLPRFLDRIVSSTIYASRDKERRVLIGETGLLPYAY